MSRALAPLTLPVGERLASALQAFDCCGERYADDPIAEQVNGFLRDRQYEHHSSEGFSVTHLWVDIESDADLVGYFALAAGSLSVTKEERERLGRPEFAGIPAVKLVWIGLDHRHHEAGLGTELLELAIGKALEVAAIAGARLMIADANPRLQGWYERRGFEVNDKQGDDSRRSFSSLQASTVCR